MAGGQQAENTLHENAIGWAILAAVIAVIIYIFWYYNAEQVRNIVRWVRFGEMWVIQWPIMLLEMVGLVEAPYTISFNGGEISFWDILNGNTDTVRAQLANAGSRVRDPNQSLYYGITNYDMNALTFTHLALFSAASMSVVKYVFMAIFGAGTLWCVLFGPRTHNRVRLGLEGLIHRQASNFPVIAPFVDFNPGTQPPRPPGSPVPAELPVFAEALGPEEWIAYNNIPIPDGKIDAEIAKKNFQKQLIGRWKGAMALPPYMQVLLAAFCLKAARKRNEGDAMLGRLAMCWTFKGGLNLSQDKTLLKEARRILKDKKLSAETLAKCNQHAFITTAMLRALNTAREEGGVLAPAQFVWLRGYNRTLFYPLNNLGRQSFHLEALGAMAHYKAEKLTMRPIPVPKVDFAVETITEYMQSRKARPIPQLDYSSSKKRGIKKAV